MREFWHPFFFSNVGGLYSCSTQCTASSALVVTGVEPFDMSILPTLTQCTCWQPRRITSIREIRKLTSWILNSFVHQNLYGKKLDQFCPIMCPHHKMKSWLVPTRTSSINPVWGANLSQYGYDLPDDNEGTFCSSWNWNTQPLFVVLKEHTWTIMTCRTPFSLSTFLLHDLQILFLILENQFFG